MPHKLTIIILSFVLGVVTILIIQFAADSRDPRLEVPEAMEAQVYFEIGQYYFDNEGGAYNRELARTYLTKAATLDPQVNLELWYQLGRLDFLDGDFDAALHKFEKQLEFFGEDLPNVLYMKGLTYGYKARQTEDPNDWRQAELGFINFLPYAPSSPWTRTDLAWVYFSQGKYDEMKPVLEEGLSYQPNNPWLLNMYGLSLHNTGDSEAALENFVKAKNAAAKLTPEDWGRSYPGNDQMLWGSGLNEFRTIIDKNIDVVLSSSQE